MAEEHARGGIAHDDLDVLLRFAALTMRLAVFAIMLMPMRAGERPLERGFDGLPAPRAHRIIPAHDRIMVPATIDDPDGLHRRPVFRSSVHSAQLNRSIGAIVRSCGDKGR